MIQTDVRLVPAALAQKSVLGNLIQLYLYDMTEQMPFPVGPDGRFGYDFLERFWRFPYLIYSSDEIAGFALVVDECPLTGRQPCFFMAEFTALDLALALHPGNWHIGVPLANMPAQAFWGRTLAPHLPASRDLTFEGDAWRLHAFSTLGAQGHSLSGPSCSAT